MPKPIKITGRWNHRVVDAAREDSQANLALIAELEAMNVVGVTSRKLERWRQVGAIPRVVQESIGRGGTQTRWPPGTARQVAALVKLLERRVPLRECPLALFHLGFPIDVEVLRRDYLEMFRRLAAGIETVGGADVTDPLDRADSVARAAANRASRGSTTRQWEFRLLQARRAGRLPVQGTTREALQDIWATALTGLMAGERPTLEGTADLLNAIGLNDGQDVGHAAETLSRINIGSITTAIQLATVDEWEQARADCDALFAVARSRRQAEIAMVGEADGLVGLDDFLQRYDDPMFAERVGLTPVMLVLPTAQWREALASHQVILDAITRLLSDTPTHVHRFLGPDGARALAEATQTERDEVSALFLSWAQAHPAEAAAIQRLTETGDAQDQPV